MEVPTHERPNSGNSSKSVLGAMEDSLKAREKPVEEEAEDMSLISLACRMLPTT